MIRHAWQDLRFAARLLRRSPLFTLVAVASLAIGIGANTTIFSVVNSLLVRPRPGVVEANLIDVGRTQGGAGFDNMSYPNYLDYREAGREVLEDLAALSIEPRPMSLTEGDGAIRIYGQTVSGNFFDVLGVRPAAGRFFLPAEDLVPGERLVAVASYRFWQEQFGGDPSVVGRAVTLNGRPFTIVGITPDGFTGTMVLRPDVWVPINTSPSRDLLTMRAGVWLMGVGRLKSGVSIAQAQAALSTIATRLEHAYPDDNEGKGVVVLASSTFPADLGVYVRSFLSILTALVGLVLLIASVNVAGMLLARAPARRREIAVRLAIGAGRGRLVRQLVTESLVLFLVGGAAGLLLAIWLRSLLAALVPQLPVPVTLDLPLDWRVLAFTTLVSLVAGVLTGLAPALRVSRDSVVPALKDDGQGSGGRRFGLRNLLVTSQVALALLLVVAAGLFLRALQGAGSIDPGLDPANVEIASLDLSLSGLDEGSGQTFSRILLERVRALPGVESASLSRMLALDGSGFGLGGVRPADHALPNGREMPGPDWNLVSPDFFKTLGIRLAEGRVFEASDREGTPPVAIINQTLANQLWPGESAIGRRLVNPAAGPNTTDLVIEVVGVEKDRKYRSLDEAPRGYIYVPLAQRYFPRVHLLVKRVGGPSVIPAVRGIVRDLNPNLPIVQAQALSEYIAVGLLPQRVALSVAGSLGVVGLLLAAVGIYGVTAYSVSRRTREIGIRIALGAARGDVVRMVLRQGAVLAGAGIVAGLVVALAASRAIASMLYGIGPADPLTYAIAAAIFVTMLRLKSTSLKRRLRFITRLRGRRRAAAPKPGLHGKVTHSYTFRPCKHG